MLGSIVQAFSSEVCYRVASHCSSAHNAYPTWLLFLFFCFFPQNVSFDSEPPTRLDQKRISYLPSPPLHDNANTDNQLREDEDLLREAMEELQWRQRRAVATGGPHRHQSLHQMTSLPTNTTATTTTFIGSPHRPTWTSRLPSSPPWGKRDPYPALSSRCPPQVDLFSSNWIE